MPARNTPDKFWKKVDKSSDGCWEWLGSRDGHGYGRLSYVSIKKQKGPLGAHVVAWILTHGEIPAGMIVMHECDNPPCCRPSHLLLGTHADNSNDCAIKKRTAWGIKSGKNKLSEKRAVNIAMAVAQGVPQMRLARIYGIHHSTISLLVRKKRWKYFDGILDIGVRQSF